MTIVPRFRNGYQVTPDNAPSSMYARMLSGDLYKASDGAISEANTCAMALTTRFNALPVGSADATTVLRDLLGHVGEGVTIRRPFEVDYGRHIAVGGRVFMNFGCQILDPAPVIIGELCQLAPRVILTTAYHPIDPVARAASWESAGPITLGRNVWLGAGVSVLPNVTIGDNTVVGAGSVVTRDLPANVLAVGTPARVVREITDADRIVAADLPADEWEQLDYGAYPDLA